MVIYKHAQEFDVETMYKSVPFNG